MAILCLFFVNNVQAVQRGRPVLNPERTTFVADNGQLLRGPFTSSEWSDPAPADQIANTRNLGFNAVHLYGECYDINYPDPGSTAPGYAASRIDGVVAATRDAGLYLVITIGNGANNGNYNLDYVVDFWDFYAPRYANETHVIYEVQNEPVAWGPPYSNPNATPPGAVNMEIAAYNTIRSHAPNTPILLFSYAVPWGSGGAYDALTDIQMFNTAVFGNANAVWTNEAVAIHGYSGKDLTAEFAQTMIGFGYPCFQTEFAGEIWGEEWGNFELYTALKMEETNVSWLTFQYIPPWGVSDDITVPKIYKDRVERSGMSWTPDYGTFPQVRGPFGNGGQPRSTTGLSGTLRIQAEDFDTGGQDITYNDTTPSNLGGQYRPGEGVDIEITSDPGGGYNIGSTADGEWLEYTIFVTEPGLHNIRLRVACPVAGCAAKVIAYNLDKTGRWSIPNTGGNQTWTTITKQVFLEYGHQKLRIEMPTGGFNLNWIELSPSSTGPFSDGTFKLANQNSGLVIENSSHNAVQNAYTGANTQQWNLQHQGAGQYRLRAANDNWQWSTSILIPQGNGYYRLMNVDSGLDYEIENASLAGGAAIISSEYTGSPNQKWAVLAPSAPAFPVGLQADWNGSDQVELIWTASTGATTYNVKRSVVSGGPYTTLATNVTGTSYTDTEATVGLAYYYVVSANTASGESSNSAEVSPLKKLTGTIIGTSGSWNNDPTRTKEAAMDGNMSTFYDAFNASGDWVGLDLGSGAAYVVTEIRYVPRSGSAGRMVGGKFQGSTTADFSSGVTDLFTVSGEPSSGVYTIQPIQNLTPYRYVRYLSAPNGYCNVAEIEFYSAGIPGNIVPAPTGLVAYKIPSGQINLTWQASLNAISYTVKRSTTSGGPYTTLADDITATSYGDTNTAPGETYYYVVSANTADDHSADSDEATTVEPHAHLSFDETAGTTAADATGNSWNGTLVNGPVWSAGYFDNGVDLDGTDDHVTLPTGVVDGLTDVTISTWVYLNSASNWARVFDFGTGSTVNMFLTPSAGGTNAVRFSITTSGAGGEQKIDGTQALPLGAWTHVAVTIDGGSGVLYVNGSPVGTNGSMTLTPDSMGATNQNYIGRSQYSDPYLDGTVDDFRIWPVALSGDQIGILMNESIPDQSPLTPANLMTDTVSISEIDLSWDASAEATNYNIKRSTNAGRPYTIIAGTGGTSYSDTELDEGTTYYYVVSAVNTAGESGDSVESEGMTLAIPPSAPTGLAAVAGDHSVALNWNANPEGDLAGYNVYRSTTQGSGYVLLNGSLLISPEYIDDTANNFTRYFYVVMAVDTDTLESSYSNEVEAMPDDGTLVQLSGTDFESDLGDWVNISGDDTHDWSLDCCGTLTPNTGPSSGASGSTWYLYLETTPGAGASDAGDTAILESPVIGGFGRILTFDYHMYGLDIGTLSVDVYDGSWHYNIWSISGQQQTGSADEYIRATVDLTDYTGPIQIRLRATSAGNPAGDMAIDNIDVTGRIFYGDIDGDGVVNENDLSDFILNWLQVNCDLDLDGDCVITLYEFSRFAGNWMTLE